MFQSRISAADDRLQGPLKLLDRGASALEVRALADHEIEAALPALGQLRAHLFREWPYLYDPQESFERDYLRALGSTEGAALIVALDGQDVVGAATASPLAVQEADLIRPLAGAGWDIPATFYFGESLLLPAYRGRGIGHIFFDLREQQARAAGARHTIFGSVIRPASHPARPSDYSPLDPFWRRRGYRPLVDIRCALLWQDKAAALETPHPMQLWHRDLTEKPLR